jgi:exodeoxyribonuclease V beta subunit
MSQIADLNVFDCALDGINLIEASAGTGKTWNICGLYLRLLLERQLDVQQILVVTFTNAATAELRERIRTRIVETLDYVAHGSAPAGDTFVKDLVTSLIDRRGLVAQDIALRLNLALQTFDEASIFTIHRFCQRALTDNSFGAGLPMSFALLQDDSELLMEAVHDFWRRHIAGDILVPELAAFLVAKKDTPEKYAALLKRQIAKPLAATCWPDDIDTEPVIDGVALERAYAHARATWHSNSGEIRELLGRSLGALNGTTYNDKSLSGGEGQWDELFRSANPQAKLGDKLRLYRDSVLDNRKKKGATPPSHVFFTQAEAFLALREVVDSALTTLRLKLLQALFNEATLGLRESKRLRRVVSFDDMLFNVYERLTNGLSPWLPGSLKARFPAALIDEFQDTDPLQFKIFQTIYGKGDTPLFLVGDPKQAIYSFRHADLHTYLRAKQEATSKYSLAANQRSSKALLAALNGLFASNAQAFMLPGLDYHQVGVGGKPRKTFQDQSAPRGDLQVWLLPENSDGPLLKKPARRVVVQSTAGEIARLLAEAGSGRISIDGVPLRAGDIAVLVRSHSQGSEMKRALEQLRVGSVEISQTSVFQSTDAEELERVLKGILEPSRDRMVRAALATDFIGCDANELEAISLDEARLMSRIIKFTEYRDIWLQRGFGVMYRRVLATEHVAERMLARSDGERRLTNFLHLGESLHQASESHPSPDALLRYLQTKRQEDGQDDAAQLRLESDQNLVKIITIHKSKGLEYPIVFCPFLWDGRTSFGGPGIEGLEYHDDQDRPVVDFRGDSIDATVLDNIKEKIRLENAAETLRLIYVALTRAEHRCYLVAGCYSIKSSVSESARSMLNWLVAGQGKSPKEWFAAKLTAGDVNAGWTSLAGRLSPHIDVSPIPTDFGEPIESHRTDPETLTARPPPPRFPSGWQVSSYSGLSLGAVNETAASDHDARISEQPRSTPVPVEIDSEDILRFPRGAEAGHCIHSAFEEADFTERTTWKAAIAAALLKHPQALPGHSPRTQRERLSEMLTRLLGDVTATELIDGLRLSSILRNRRLTEFEFNLPASHLSAAELSEALKSYGYDGPRLNFRMLEGYLKGFMDLVFEHQGRFFILDWKSNHLGYAATDYAGEPVARAMAEHGYHLQYLLYAVALDRYLRGRIVDYQYETHFGGVLYLFVRGVRPTWTNPDGSPAGVLFHRPTAHVVQRLNELLGAPSVEMVP